MPNAPTPSPTITPAPTPPDAQVEIVVRPMNQGDFVWPPAPHGSIVPPSSHPQNRGHSRLLALLHSIETTLLGRTALSFARQAVLENWRPDDDLDYCWRCGGSIGAHESDGEGCASCRNTKLQWDQAVRLGKYEGLVRDAVLDLKFHRWRTSGREIGASLGKAIAERMERAQVLPHELVIVPIPISSRRRIKRGIDHTRVLAEGVSQITGCPMSRMLKAKHRPEQVGLSMTARGRNIKGAFRAPKDVISHLGKNCRVVVLIDDVRTTGATLTTALKTIKNEIRETKMKGVQTPEVEYWVATAGVVGGKARDRQILKN